MSWIDFLGKPWELIRQWFATPWLLLCAIVISLCLWLYITPARLLKLGLQEASLHRQVVLALLLAATILLCQVVKLLSCWIAHQVSRDHERRALQRRIRKLSLPEKSTLRAFMDQHSQYIRLDEKSEAVASLQRKKIIRVQFSVNSRRSSGFFVISDLVESVLYEDPSLLRETSSTLPYGEDWTF